MSRVDSTQKVSKFRGASLLLAVGLVMLAIQARAAAYVIGTSFKETTSQSLQLQNDAYWKSMNASASMMTVSFDASELQASLLDLGTTVLVTDSQRIAEIRGCEALHPDLVLGRPEYLSASVIVTADSNLHDILDSSGRQIAYVDDNTSWLSTQQFLKDWQIDVTAQRKSSVTEVIEAVINAPSRVVGSIDAETFWSLSEDKRQGVWILNPNSDAVLSVTYTTYPIVAPYQLFITSPDPELFRKSKLYQQLLSSGWTDKLPLFPTTYCAWSSQLREAL